MRVMAQMAMVMNLDKCIGCHTCSVTCKQAWTNRAGTEYVWFNNVETRPGQGYPRRYEDQETWKGGWTLNRRGQPHPQGRRPLAQAAAHLLQPQAALDPGLLRAVDLRLQHAHRRPGPAAHARGPAQVTHLGQRHEDHLERQLGRRPRRLDRPRTQGRPARDHRRQGQVRVRADVHVLPAAHLRALPQPVLRRVLPLRGDLQAQRGRHRPGRPGPLPRLAHVRLRLPVQEGLLQPPHRQGREVHVLLPAHRGRPADRLLRDLRRPAALHRAGAVRRRPGPRGGVDHGRPGPLRGPAQRLPRPPRPRRGARGRAGRHPAGLGAGGAAVAGLGADQQVRGGAAAAPGVPHDADGLVHPTAVAGRRHRPRHRSRRRGQGEPVRRHRRAAHPGRVPRRAVHRRRHAHAWTPSCAGSRRCAPTCARSAWGAPPTSRSPQRSA